MQTASTEAARDIIAPTPPKRELGGRMDECASRAAAGKSNKLIAKELGISEATVKVHLKQVFLRLGISHRSELVRRYPVSLYEQPMPELNGRVIDADQLGPTDTLVFDCISHGMTNKQIAAKLGIAEGTVRQKVRHALSQIGVENRVVGARWWVMVCGR